MTLPMFCRCTQPGGRVVPTQRQLWPSTRVVSLVYSWLALDRLMAFSRSSSRGQSLSAMTVFWMAWIETELWRWGVPGVSRIKQEAAGRPLVVGDCLAVPVSDSCSTTATKYGNLVFHTKQQPHLSGPVSASPADGCYCH